MNPIGRHRRRFGGGRRRRVIRAHAPRGIPLIAGVPFTESLGCAETASQDNAASRASDLFVKHRIDTMPVEDMFTMG